MSPPIANSQFLIDLIGERVLPDLSFQAAPVTKTREPRRPVKKMMVNILFF